MRMRSGVGLIVGTLFVALMTTEAAFAAPYPLEITAPRANLPSTHRMVRAYPGLLFNIRAAVVGGMYPFTYSLNNAPSGMTINSQTGEMNWPNPTSNASPTLVVRDAEGARFRRPGRSRYRRPVSGSWTR